MKIFRVFLCLAVIPILSGCAAELSKNLQTLNQSLQTRQAAGNSALGFSQNVMPPSETARFESKLSPNSSDRALTANWNSLKPLADKLVSLSACGVGPWPQNGGQNEIEAWKSLGRYIDPDVRNPHSHGSFPLAIWHTQYHPRSACMNILRVDKWSMPSKNSISFRVQFISDISNETVFVIYLFKANEEGTWLYSNATLSP